MIFALLVTLATEAVTLGWRLLPDAAKDIVADGIYAAGDDIFDSTTVQGDRRLHGTYRYPSNKYAPEGTPL